jgi:hypothetical protein
MQFFADARRCNALIFADILFVFLRKLANLNLLKISEIKCNFSQMLADVMR